VVDGGNIRLLLIALFAVLGEWYLATAARALWRREKGHAGHALGAALYALASAAVISMFWSWGAGVPAIAQVTVFTAAAGWFTGQAVFGAGGDHSEGTYQNWYHAGMMAVMVWMAVVIPLTSVPSEGGAISGISGPGSAMTGMDMGGMDMGGMDMGGMDMGGMGGQAPAADGGTVLTAGSVGWAGTVCLVLAAALFAAAAWQAVVALRPVAAPGQGRAPGPSRNNGAGVVLRDGIGALMAVGMAVALLEIA